MQSGECGTAVAGKKPEWLPVSRWQGSHFNDRVCCENWWIIDGCFEWRTHWPCQRSQTVCLPHHLESGLYSSTTIIWHEVVSEDDVRKLVMKSKTTSCALDPMPTKLVNQYIAELLPLLMHTINLSIPNSLRNGRPHLLCHCLKRQDWTPFKKTIVLYRISNMSLS